jgi:hypothetical protein
MGEMINAFWISGRKKDGKISLQKVGRKWEANVKLVVKERGFKEAGSIQLVRDKADRGNLANTEMILWVP